jgi:hypothetical protein
MDRLIQKQQRIAEQHNDVAEFKKLDRFKESKVRVVDNPKERKIKLKDTVEKVKEHTKFEREREGKVKDDRKGIPGIVEDEKGVKDVEDTDEFKNMTRIIANSERDSGLAEGTEVTHRNIHVLANAVNNHIWEMEQSGTHKNTKRNRTKYETLGHLLEEVQKQKAKFERPASPKPKGFGRLRK